MLKKNLIIILLFSVLIISFDGAQFAFAGFVDADGDGIQESANCTPELAAALLCDPDSLNPCVPNPNSPACLNSPIIGGEIIPIDTTALLLAGSQTSILWMMPLLGAFSAVIIYIKKKLEILS